MVINENNSQINSFTKGMNSDSAYDQVENTQYTFGKNIRITKNYLLNQMKLIIKKVVLLLYMKVKMLVLVIL